MVCGGLGSLPVILPEAAMNIGRTLKRLTLKAALYTLLQIVSLTLFEKMPTRVVGGGGEI